MRKRQRQFAVRFWTARYLRQFRARFHESGLIERSLGQRAEMRATV